MLLLPFFTFLTDFIIFYEFFIPLCLKSPIGKFDKPFRIKDLTTDYLSPFSKKLTLFLGHVNVTDLTHCTRFPTSPFFDGFVIPLYAKPLNDKFDKPFRNKDLTTDFLSPFLKKLTLFFGHVNVTDLTRCTHFSTSPFFDRFIIPLYAKPLNNKFDKPFRN